MKIILINLLFITLLLADVKSGENFPSLRLLNQYSESIDIPKEGEVTLLLSFEKDSSTAIQEFLEKQNSSFLSNHHLIYISDISSLPNFLVKLFVLPKLKKFDFEVALLYEEYGIQREEKKVTIISIKDNIVTNVTFLARDELEKFMVKLISS